MTSSPWRWVIFRQTNPVALYSLTVTLKLGNGSPIVAPLANVGGFHSGSIDFANAAAGTYAYSIKAKRIADNATRTVESGNVIVLADPATQDTRSHSEKVLEAIEALIEGRATKDVASYSIAGRSLTRLSPDELVKWRAVYRREVAVQRAAGLPMAAARSRLQGSTDHADPRSLPPQAEAVARCPE